MAPFSLALHPYGAANRSLGVKALIKDSKRWSSPRNTVKSIQELKKPKHQGDAIICRQRLSLTVTGAVRGGVSLCLAKRHNCDAAIIT